MFITRVMYYVLLTDPSPTSIRGIFALVPKVYITQLTTRSTGVFSSQLFGSNSVGLACITSLCSIRHFPGCHSLHLAFGSFFYSHPSSPLYSSTVNQCDRCLVPLAWGLMAGGQGFASHGGVTLSRGWLCQRWNPLDILDTHLD